MPRSSLIEPAGAPEVPGFEMRVLEAPARHFRNHPFGGIFVIGRSREPRTIAVREYMQSVHDLRTLGFFLADAGVDAVIHLSEHK
jgi:hypothetical protein